VYKDLEALLQVSYNLPVGMLAYVTGQESIYLRVRDGWRTIQLGQFIPNQQVEPNITEAPNANIIPAPSISLTGPVLRMVALDKPMGGSMRGIRGADYECHRQARRSGLSGTYRAFLSSDTQNLNSIIYYSKDRQIPVVNSRNQVLFGSWNEIVNGSGASFNGGSTIYSFDGRDIMADGNWPQKIIWHGSNAKGEFIDNKLCNKWHSGSSEDMGRASSLLTHKLIDQEEYTCSNAFIVLCIENSARHN
jgi:collagen type XVIII alpha